MQEILAGLGIWERILVEECVWRMSSFCVRWLGGQGSFLGISWKGSQWGQKDTAKEQHRLDHGGSAETALLEKSSAQVGKWGKKRHQDWSELGSVLALGTFNYPGHGFIPTLTGSG